MLNIYSYIIIIALLTDTFINFAADMLNIRSLTSTPPEEFRDIHDAESYAQSQEYTKTNLKFSWGSSFFSLLILLLFWGFGGFSWLHRWVESIGLHPVFSGIIFICVLMVAKLLLTMPFSIYSTFVIEERFGFNRTTARTFILDMIKTLFLGLIIGVPLLAAILYLFEVSGGLAWLYGWGVTSVILLFVQFVAPRWIMPIFNEFKPLEDEELKQSIEKLAESADFKVKDVSVIDGSRRSSKANAFFAGFGANRRIALFDTLLDKLNKDEVLAVLAHEIGHFRKKHVPLNIGISLLHAGVLFFLLSIFLNHQGMFNAFGITGSRPVYAGLVFFSLLYHPIEMILSLLMGFLSRYSEYSADSYAVELIGSGKELAEALKVLSRDSLSNLTPHKFYVILNYSHPPVLERVQNLKKNNRYLDQD